MVGKPTARIESAHESGTPVLASRMSGNLGMLGPDHAGYFPVGDDAAAWHAAERAMATAYYAQHP